MVEGLLVLFFVVVIDLVILLVEVSVEVIMVNGLIIGIYFFQLIGNSGVVVDMLELEIFCVVQVFGVIMFLVLQEGNNNILVMFIFIWVLNFDVFVYDIEVVVDVGFVDILFVVESIVDIFLIVMNFLFDSIILFWCVRGWNLVCGVGSFIIQFFEIEGFCCEIFEVMDVLIDLGVFGFFVILLIEVEVDVLVWDVNIVEIVGNYSLFDCIDFCLCGFNGDLQDIFVDNDCLGGFLFNFLIDDVVNSEVFCLFIGGFYCLVEFLVVYNGVFVVGVWCFVMFKIGQNGFLVWWLIEICYGVFIMISIREIQVVVVLQVFFNLVQERVIVVFLVGVQVQGQVELFSVIG